MKAIHISQHGPENLKIAEVPTAGDSATLAGLRIMDSAGNAVYQETFPYALADGRFAETLAASASIL
jgi:hypothetical protein